MTPPSLDEALNEAQVEALVRAALQEDLAVGALTHSAPVLEIAFDLRAEEPAR